MGRGPSIEGRKNAEDAKRAKVFTKLIREITVAARNGADPSANAALRSAIDKALSANMTRDTVDRAVKRGAGAEGADNMQELRYEGYGPSGVALIIDCLTDNPQRTVADVRHALSKHGGNLGTTGSVAFQFSRIGELAVTTADAEAESKAFEVALEAGADDVQTADGESLIVCAADQLENVRKALIAAGMTPTRAAAVWRAANVVTVTGDTAETLIDLIDWLEDLDDVQEVWHNAVMPE